MAGVARPRRGSRLRRSSRALLDANEYSYKYVHVLGTGTVRMRRRNFMHGFLRRKYYAYKAKTKILCIQIEDENFGFHF